MKINSKHYILVTFAICATVFSILGYIFMYKTIITQAGNSSKFTSEINTGSENKQREDELIKIYNNTVADRSKITSFLVQDDKIVDFIEKIEKIGDYSNTDINLSSIDTADGYVSAHIDTKGSWSSIMQALILIENLPYSLSINNVRTDVSENHKWNLTLDIKVLTTK